MAIEILEGKKGTVHEYYHDLELLFYVLVWICTMQNGPCSELRDPGFKYKRSVLSIWNGGLHNASITFEVVAFAKRATMFSPTKFKSDILDCFASYFEPVKDCLEKLRSIIFPPEFLSDDKETLSDTVNDKEEIQKLPPKLQNFLRKMVSSVDTPPIHFQKIKDVLDETIEEFKKRNLHIRTARPPPPTVDQFACGSYYVLHPVDLGVLYMAEVCVESQIPSPSSAKRPSDAPHGGSQSKKTKSSNSNARRSKKTDSSGSPSSFQLISWNPSSSPGASGSGSRK